ncbi:hypothetical protein [Streptomyces albireticuli]|uniref:Uncharacterized protein n=1 Tax=Streptomyces albireticuli TaxID=1940 RepID=A0A2A2D657_9ACTN|nr:hypothetical protein [Streptomyces albireticuli]MCD9165757.1 hypothetical protein [Streptomyces albireticuli]MCD9195975.1 hypothetical protein [Streptomyces albireticuli]PAU46926.1 hypothetical protein CK936_21780 [Streptomyces albireticuli]
MLISGTVFALVYMQTMMAIPLTLDRRCCLEPTDTKLLFTALAATVIATNPPCACAALLTESAALAFDDVCRRSAWRRLRDGAHRPEVSDADSPPEPG